MQLQEQEMAVARPNEPLTPRSSFASVFPSGLHSDHEPPSPRSSSGACSANPNPNGAQNLNPFAHLSRDSQEQRQLVDITIPPGHEMVWTGKETFYTNFNEELVRARRFAYG